VGGGGRESGGRLANAARELSITRRRMSVFFYKCRWAWTETLACDLEGNPRTAGVDEGDEGRDGSRGESKGGGEGEEGGEGGEEKKEEKEEGRRVL
jgi:hypothetical protein